MAMLKNHWNNPMSSTWMVYKGKKINWIVESINFECVVLINQSKNGRER